MSQFRLTRRYLLRTVATLGGGSNKHGMSHNTGSHLTVVRGDNCYLNQS